MYEIRQKYQRRNDNYQNKDKDNAAIVEKNHPQRNAFRRKQHASGSTRDIFDAHKKDNDLVIDINIRIKSKDKYNNRNQERGYNNNYATKANNKYSGKTNYSWKVNNNNDDKEPVKWTRYNRNKEEYNPNEKEDNIDNNNNNDKNKIAGKTYNGRNKNFKSYSITKTTSIAYKRKTPSRDYTNYIYAKSEREKEAPVQIKNNYDSIPNEIKYENRRERFNENRANEDLEAAEQKEKEDKIEPKYRRHFANSAVNGSRRYNKNDTELRNDNEEEIGQKLDNRNNNGKYGRYDKYDINNNKYNKYNKYEDKKDDDDYNSSKSRYHYKPYNRNDNENKNEDNNDIFDKKQEDNDLNRIRMKYKVDEKNNNDKYNNKKDEDNDYHYNSKYKNKYEDQNNNKYRKKEENEDDHKLKVNDKYNNKINNNKYSQNENNYNNYKSKTNSQYDNKTNNNSYGQREDDDHINSRSGINNKYNNKYTNEYNNKYNNKYDNKYNKENINDKYDENIDDNINNNDLGPKNEKPYIKKYHNNYGIQNGNNEENDKENNNDNDINNNYEIKVNINSKKFDNDAINHNNTNNNNYNTNSNTNTNNINHNNKKKYRYKSLNKDYMSYGETIKEEDNEDLNLPSQRGRFNRLKNALIEIERFNAKKTLKGDMAEMFNKILKSNFDFKENIFFKNLIDTDLKVGDLDSVKKRPVSHTFKEIETIEILRNHQNADDLMKKYTNRAKLIVDED